MQAIIEGRGAGLGGGDGRVDGVGVVAVDFLHVPAGGAETGHLVGAVGEANLAVDGDVVVVPEDDEATKLMPPGKADGLVADAFHQAAVTGDDIGVVIHQRLAIAGAQDFLGHGKPHGVGNALTERAGGGFDARCMAVFGMARGDRTPLAEIAELVERHLGVAGEMQERIKQHRAVPGREDETVAIRPVGGGGIEFEVPGIKHRGNIGHAHRHAGMA